MLNSGCDHDNSNVNAKFKTRAVILYITFKLVCDHHSSRSHQSQFTVDVRLDSVHYLRVPHSALVSIDGVLRSGAFTLVTIFSDVGEFGDLIPRSLELDI